MARQVGKVERFLSEEPAFPRQQFRDIVGAGQSTNTADTLLSHHVGSRRITHAAPGVYAAVPLHLNPDGFVPDAVLVASMVRDDGILAQHSALSLHGLAHLEVGEIQVLSSGKPWLADSVCGPKRLARDPAERQPELSYAGVIGKVWWGCEVVDACPVHGENFAKLRMDPSNDRVNILRLADLG